MMNNMIPSCHSNHPDGFLQEAINEHDQKLINKARSLHYIDWMDVHEEQAQTVEGFWRLHNIASRLYHQEEASIGEL